MDLPLRYFLKEKIEGKLVLRLEEIKAQYENYASLIPDEDFQNVNGSKLCSQPDWGRYAMLITTSPNLIDVFAVLESDRDYYFMAPYRGTTLQDLLKYSSGVLNSNPSNILVDENLWITLSGFECSIPITVGGSVSQSINNDYILNLPKVGATNFDYILALNHLA
ncbi:7365_t:CDS:2, partial [Diversispora eburnea]